MIDVGAETLLTFSQAAEELSRILPDRDVSPKLVRKWASEGLKHGVLETVKIGGRRYTSLQAIARFCEHSGGEVGHLESSAPWPPPRQRRSRIGTEEYDWDEILKF